MECKKLLKKLKLKGYFVAEGTLKPINHRETISIDNIDKPVIIVKLKDIVNRIKNQSKKV